MRKNLLVGMMALVTGLVLAGCDGLPWLTRGQEVDRAEFGATALPGEETPPARPTVRVIEPVEPTVTGTYQFTVPETVTRLKRSTNTFEQYTLYQGQPGPTDKPFLVITVGKGFKADAEDAASGMEATKTRSYMLHGMLAKEWTGYTKEGVPFNELILVHDEKRGDQLHAVALARNEEQRKLALDVLGSLSWKSNP